LIVFLNILGVAILAFLITCTILCFVKPECDYLDGVDIAGVMVISLVCAIGILALFGMAHCASKGYMLSSTYDDTTKFIKIEISPFSSQDPIEIKGVEVEIKPPEEKE
jgi:hypothetical protein